MLGLGNKGLAMLHRPFPHARDHGVMLKLGYVELRFACHVGYSDGFTTLASNLRAQEAT